MHISRQQVTNRLSVEKRQDFIGGPQRVSIARRGTPEGSHRGSSEKMRPEIFSLTCHTCIRKWWDKNKCTKPWYLQGSDFVSPVSLVSLDLNNERETFKQLKSQHQFHDITHSAIAGDFLVTCGNSMFRKIPARRDSNSRPKCREKHFWSSVRDSQTHFRQSKYTEGNLLAFRISAKACKPRTCLQKAKSFHDRRCRSVHCRSEESICDCGRTQVACGSWQNKKTSRKSHGPWNGPVS